MKSHLVVIKVGGGLITDKNKPFTARPEFIDLFASELSSLRKSHKDVDFLVGNGGGSFAHFTAHEYGLRQGAKTAEQYYGMCLTHNGVRKLNGLVADALSDTGVPAFALSPSALCMCTNGEISTSHFKPVQHLLANGCVPVLHGDTMCDDVLGTIILSTEKILLACMGAVRDQYKKITVIYLVTTDGVLDEAGVTIPRLGKADNVFVHQALGHDVTGGIIGKVESAREVAKQAGAAAYLVNGTVSGEIEKVLTTGVAGTVIDP